MTTRTELITILQGDTSPLASFTDVDDDRLVIFTAQIPELGPGINIRTDKAGCSFPVAEIPALIDALQAIAEEAKRQAGATLMTNLPHESYITAVAVALAGADLDPTSWRAVGDDEEQADQEPTGLSAGLFWYEDHPAVDTARFEFGIAVYWSPATGWEWAEFHEDWSVKPLQRLPLTRWATPTYVTRAVSDLLAGRPMLPEQPDEWHGAEDARAAVAAWRAEQA